MPIVLQLVVTLLGILILCLMPKRLTRQQMYMTWIATAVVAYSLDGIFGGVLKLYYYLNSRIEIYDVFFQLVTVPPFGIIFLNFMPKKLLQFVVYSLVWTVISILVEYLAVKIQLLVYNGWKQWYSPPFYFLGCVYLRWHLAFIRRGSHSPD